MAGITGTVETLALELGRALQPLQDALDTSFFAGLGVELPREVAADTSLQATLASARTEAGKLEPSTQSLAQAIADGNKLAILGAAEQLSTALTGLFGRLNEVGGALSNAIALLPAEQRAVLQEFASRITTRIVEALSVDYLGERMPSLAGTLEALGLLDRSPEPHPELEVDSGEQVSVPARLHLDRLPLLLTQPAEYLRQTFQWGTTDFDARTLLNKLQSVLERLGVPAAVYDQSAGSPRLEAFVFAAQPDTSASPPGLQFELALPGKLNFDNNIDFSGLWKGSVQVDANFAPGVEVTLRPPFSLSAKPPSGNLSLNAKLDLNAEKSEADPLTLFGVTGGSRVTAKRVGGSIGVNANLGSLGGAVSPNVELHIDGGRLVFDSSEGDGFISETLASKPVAVNFDLAAKWSPEVGLQLQGHVGEAFIPTRVDLGLACVDGVYVSVGADGAAGLEIALATRLSTKLGPLSAAIDRVGIKSSLAFPQNGGKFGLGDLNVGFKPPSGIALAVEAGGAISGGGYLFHDAARGLYAGAMQLSLHGQITLKAFGLISTKMPDGSRGYSLLVFITAEDFRPIPLGLGFTLLSIGGMVGINRTFDVDVLRARLSSGALASLLFPRDPVGNADSLMRAVSSAFPVRRGSYLLGLMAKIGWFTPTLVLFDLALILEFGTRQRLLALGRISALLPSADNDLVRLNMDAMGVIDFDAGTVAIDAELCDSRLAHKFPITGSAALRAGFGEGAGFVLSVGGFNPRFAAPTTVPPLKRVAIALSAGNNPRLTCDAYFAITSNTVQFGADASLYAAAAGFSVAGNVGFDVLVQLAPLHFIADFHAKLQLKRGSHKLFMVALKGALEGPRPLRISGKATFEILWCDFSVRFDATLVKGERPPLPPAVNVFAQLTQALASSSSWSTQRSATQAHGVALRSLPAAAAGAPIVLDPLGQLSVTQQVAPLNTSRDIEIFGGAPVAGARRFSLTASLSGTPLSSAPLRASFAPAQFFSMSDDEKLAAPSFESLDAGCVFGDALVSFDASQAIPAPLEYETVPITLDGSAPNAPGTAPPPFTLSQAQLESFADNGAVARAPIRRVGRARFRNDAVAGATRFASTRWTVMPTGEGQAPEVDAAVRSYSEHQALVNRMNRGGTRWQVVPANELEA